MIMTRTEELLVALMEFDNESLARFVKTLSFEDLLRFEQGLRLATVVANIEQITHECDSNSTRLNRMSLKRLLEDQRVKAQNKFMQDVRSKR